MAVIILPSDPLIEAIEQAVAQCVPPLPAGIMRIIQTAVENPISYHEKTNGLCPTIENLLTLLVGPTAIAEQMQLLESCGGMEVIGGRSTDVPVAIEILPTQEVRLIYTEKSVASEFDTAEAIFYLLDSILDQELSECLDSLIQFKENALLEARAYISEQAQADFWNGQWCRYFAMIENLRYFSDLRRKKSSGIEMADGKEYARRSKLLRPALDVLIWRLENPRNGKARKLSDPESFIFRGLFTYLHQVDQDAAWVAAVHPLTTHLLIPEKVLLTNIAFLQERLGELPTLEDLSLVLAGMAKRLVGA